MPVTAFGPNPDGPGTPLRLWEMAGVSGDVTVTLPAGAKHTSAQSVNLRVEKSGESVPLTNGMLSFRLVAFAPASFMLE